MIKVFDQSTRQQIGTITEEQLQFLIDQLEEESEEDRDYAITRMTVDFLAEQGAASDLLALLRSALGNKDEVTIRWSSG
jgi:processive 1,2-diacylglycerol beta-glucosyltransferase